MRKAYLVLENGSVFEGQMFGCEKEVVAELVFSTSMVGYMEALTDPAYEGQILLQTFPMIGNYGVMENDTISDKVHVSGYIVKELCDTPSNFRSMGALEVFLCKEGVTGICDIDTREVTRILRENGTMNACISFSPELSAENKALLKSYKVGAASLATTVKDSYVIPACENASRKFKAALVDYGKHKEVAAAFAARGAEVTVFPANVSADDILSGDFNAVILSGGPGDPRELTAQIEAVKSLGGSKPVFAVGLGHQILALANGFAVEKLLYGHRGASQPATMDRTYITSQNHSYYVVSESINEEIAHQTYFNANDKTCEGISYANGNYSIQFVPDESKGPHDMSFVYDDFINSIFDTAQ